MKKPKTKQHNDSKTTFIYALKDPNDGRVRYIGKSNNPQQRLLQHIYDFNGKNHKKDDWIRSIRDNEQKPILEILEEVDFAEWEDRERYWIKEYRNLYSDLLNIDDGGIPDMHRVIQANKTSRYYGVRKFEKDCIIQYSVDILFMDKVSHMGTFVSEIEAAEINDICRLALQGDSKKMNFDSKHVYSVKFSVDFDRVLPAFSSYCSCYLRRDLNYFVYENRVGDIDILRERLSDEELSFFEKYRAVLERGAKFYLTNPNLCGKL